MLQLSFLSLCEMKPQKGKRILLSQSVTKVSFDNFSVEKGCNRVVFSLLIYPVLFLQGTWKFEQL